MNEASRYLARPAIRLRNGKILVGERGDTHSDIIKRIEHRDAGIEHGFIANNGRYLSRSEARQYLFERTGHRPGVGKPESTDLKKKPKTKAGKKAKAEKIMHEYKHGELHSGSKTGPKVKSRKQAIAIMMSQTGQSRKKKRRKSVADALSK